MKGTMASNDHEAQKQAFRAFVNGVVLYPDEERVIVRFNQRKGVKGLLGAEGGI